MLDTGPRGGRFAAVSLPYLEPLSPEWFAQLRADHFAALEAERLTTPAEPDATTPGVMSGGAEPASAANHSEGRA